MFITLMVSVASAFTREFLTSHICSNTTTGSEIRVHQHVTSTILCSSLCAGVKDCLSFSHISENGTCILNKNLLDDNGQCADNVTYGVKVSNNTLTCILFKKKIRAVRAPFFIWNYYRLFISIRICVL